MSLKVGIVGHGFVGKAVDYGFCNNVTKKLINLYSTNVAAKKFYR